MNSFLLMVKHIFCSSLPLMIWLKNFAFLNLMSLGLWAWNRYWYSSLVSCKMALAIPYLNSAASTHFSSFSRARNILVSTPLSPDFPWFIVLCFPLFRFEASSWEFANHRFSVSRHFHVSFQFWLILIYILFLIFAVKFPGYQPTYTNRFFRYIRFCNFGTFCSW